MSCAATRQKNPAPKLEKSVCSRWALRTIPVIPAAEVNESPIASHRIFFERERGLTIKGETRMIRVDKAIEVNAIIVRGLVSAGY